MAITAQEKLVLDAKTSNHSGLHYMRRNPHPKKERHGDCGVRAICLALDLDYNKVWNAATKMKQMNAPTYCYNYGGGYVEYKKSKATATRGLSKTDLVDTLGYLGYKAEYVCLTKHRNQDRSTWFYFNKMHLPKQPCIVHVPNHWIAVKEGAIWDTWDSRGSRPKKLRGFVAIYQ